MLSFIDSGSEMWDESDSDAIADVEPPPFEYQNNTIEDQRLRLLIKWIVIFLSRLRVIFSLSDAASNFILKFFSVFLGLFGQILAPTVVLPVLPASIYMLRQMFDGAKEFTRYVVCRKCSAVYKLKNCKERNGSSKTCQVVSYPKHPQRRMRQPCNTILMKTVELSSNKRILYPYLTYCYLSIEASLQFMLMRPSFLTECNKWRTRRVKCDVLQDVYDGKIWKEFQVHDGVPFLSLPHNFAFTINLDWFQPFKHSTYSIGAIYLTIMNLPRTVRNKQENVLLVGLLPGPSEPSNINGYLKPLVNELNELWQGKELKIYNAAGTRLVRCALLCASCDLPAGRKLCGLLSYNAHKGCSRCLKEFKGTPGQMDYSGFERDTWMKRSEVEHRQVISILSSYTTKSAVTLKESETGYRYTELLRLPYFNPSRMLTIDPMHNLFLGSGKHILKKVWIELGLITEHQFDLVQNRTDQIVCPPDIGRIPVKIKSGFASFTADQYKNWIVYFSLFSLRDILFGPDIECWRHFILACRYLCSREISLDQIKIADTLLMTFCRRVQCMYGKEVITPNIHMHAHLHECLLDYGPAHVFWLFSFERYNGILENLPNNNRSIEVQVMRRFMENMTMCMATSLPEEYQKDFMSILSSKRVVGTLSDDLEFPLPTPLSDQLPLSYWLMNSEKKFNLPKYSSRGIFTRYQVDGLKQLYSELAGVPQSEIEVPSAFVKYQHITMYGKQVGAHRSRSSSSSLVMALQKQGAEERPATIKYFAKHAVTIQNTRYAFLLFHCWWYKSRMDKNVFGKPVTVWESDIYEPDDCYSILPVQAIKCRTVSLLDSISTGETVLLVTPCIDF